MVDIVWMLLLVKIIISRNGRQRREQKKDKERGRDRDRQTQDICVYIYIYVKLVQTHTQYIHIFNLITYACYSYIIFTKYILMYTYM